MTKENKTNELEKCTEIKTTELEQVTGGSFMFFYRDEDIEGAGVEVIGSGFLYDDGYRWRGMDISRDDASLLCDYYIWFRCQPWDNDLEAARKRLEEKKHSQSWC